MSLANPSPIDSIGFDAPELEILPDLETEKSPAKASIEERVLTLFPVSLVSVAALAFIGLMTRFSWGKYDKGLQFGFDTGIFSQGTWLLSQFQAPFITLRGLNLFGDHASFILIFVAPLYRLWPDPRLLLLLQAVAMAVPALVIYKLASRKSIGVVFALLYLMFPAMQWAATFQFHPETFAAAFLALAAYSAEKNSHRRMIVWLCLAALCKEDVSLLIVGFSAYLWVSGKRKLAYCIAGAAIAYFLIVTQLVMPGINGRKNLYFAQNYGIQQSGVLGIVVALPTLVARAFEFALSDKGLTYLALLLVPVGLLPLFKARWLLPAMAPLFLNMASKIPYQHSIEYQYLATSSPFIVIGAMAGYQELRKRMTLRMQPPLVLAIVLLIGGAMTATHGTAEAMGKPARPPAPVSTIQRAMTVIPDGAVVSAGFNFDTALSDRKTLYEFPNPFLAKNWGISGDQPSPTRAQSVEYVIVHEPRMGKTDAAVLNQLRSMGTWTTVFDESGVLVLHRNR